MMIDIGPNRVGPGCPAFIVAELSGNHLQDFDLAERTIRAMKESGADAVKLQTYTADTITIDSDQEYFQIKQGTIWDGKTLYKLYQEAYTPWDWQPKLKDLAERLGLAFFSTPFDRTAVDFLEKMRVPCYKIASFEINDIPLIEYTAAKGKPMILSTGIATFDDIREAVDACRRAENDRIVLLKCTSAYPAPLEEVNLRTLPDMAEKFGTVVGISDHTLGISVPIASVALGAKVIEKHFILDRKLGGPDAPFSLEPAEFARMVGAIREVETALGVATYELSEKVRRSRVFARSLFVVKDIRAGEPFTEENVRSIRPGYGLAPKHLSAVLGRKAKSDIKRGTPLDWNLVQ